MIGPEPSNEESYVDMKVLTHFLAQEYPRHRKLLYLAAATRILILLSVWVFVLFVLFQSGNTVAAVVGASLLYLYAAVDYWSTMKRARQDYEMLQSLKDQSDSINEWGA
jgi:uncharacterized membrane protein